ncbi:MAG TPA: efflux RND transporter periplasmic adaptor subunit [Rugosimonospora sp.]|jgi:macrolide-specific efflux system membrane fusion protein
MRAPQRWRRPALWVNVALGAVVLAGGFGAYWSLTASSTPTGAAAGGVTRTATVSTGTVTSTVSASGSVSSADTAGADFVTAGTLTEIDVKVGDTVTKGQVMAKVDPSAANQTLTTAKANLQAAQDSLSRAESSGSDTATISAAQAQVTGAQATVDADQRAVDGTVLTAPIAGTVVAVNGSVGNPSDSGSGSTSSNASSSGGGSSSGGSSGGGSGSGGSGGSSGSSSSSSSSSTDSGSTSGLIEVADLSQMQVSASFAEADAATLKVGQAADITWSALSGTQVTGKVASIAPTASSSNGVNSYAVVVSMDSVPAGVRIGQSTTVVVTTAQADNVLRVPVAAVSSAGGRHTVQLVNGTTVSLTPIQVGVQGDDYYQVSSGLTAGEVVQYRISTGTGATSGPGGAAGGGGFGGGGGGAGGGFGGGGGGFGGGGAAGGGGGARGGGQ